MRATFYRNIKTLSGKDRPADMVFQSFKDDSICIVRRYKYPTLNAHHANIGKKLAEAVKLWKIVDSGFLSDVGIYTRAYNSQVLAHSSLKLSPLNIFLMGVLKNPQTFTNLDAIADTLGLTIGSWIAGGSLPNVQVSVPLDNPIN